MKKSKVSVPHKASPPSKGGTVSPRIAVAIMAAGKGTRLKSQIPKVLHEVGGNPLLEHVIRAAQKIVPASDIFAIIGHEAERVRATTKHTGINFVLQSEQRGTGHAIMVAREALAPYDHVIVLSGDAPLITADTISKLRDFHLAEKAAMTLLSAELENPTGYGRVLRKGPRSSEVKAVVEEKAANAAQKKIREINSGFYVFSVKDLYFQHRKAIYQQRTCRVLLDGYGGSSAKVSRTCRRMENYNSERGAGRQHESGVG